MRTVPENAEAKVRFFEQQLAHWSADADAVGLGQGRNAELLGVLAADVAEARAAIDAQRLARDAARSATVRARVALAALTRSGASVVGIVRAQPIDGHESVTRLPAPRRRRRSVGPPGKPERFEATLGTLGAITLTWRCPQPDRSGGTMYEVSRRVGDGRMTHVGRVGTRRFVDDTLPAGTASATYHVQAVRSRLRGEVAEFTVNFGVAAGHASLLATGPRSRSHASKMTASLPFSSVAAA